MGFETKHASSQINTLISVVVESPIVQILQKVRTEIKAHIKVSRYGLKQKQLFVFNALTERPKRYGKVSYQRR
jgi:hypothetical protein